MKKLKIITVVLVALAMLFSVAACSSQSSTPKTDKVYKIATDTTFAPFEFEDKDGKFVGIDMELLAAIAQDQGFKYEISILGFDASLQAVQSKQVDGMIAGMSITEERKKVFDFSDPYFDSGVIMGIAKSNETIKSYEDLKDKKVAVKTGTEGATFAKSIAEKYGFTLVYFDDSANLYQDVILGNTAACFEDYPVLGYAIAKGQALKTVTQMERGSSYGFAVLKGNNPELITMFNKGLKNLKSNGKYQQILDKYIQK